MDILILNKCYNCNKEEWTSITSPYYVCSDCCTLRCPKCQEIEVMFVVSIKNEENITHVLNCLNEDCVHSENGSTEEDLYKNEEGHMARRFSLKRRNCVKRKLDFEE